MGVDVMNAIEFKEVSLIIDESTILDRLSFNVERGTVSVILGPSGAGKSTILKLVLALMPPTTGSVLVYGQDINNTSEAELNSLRHRMGVVFQANALFDSLTVEQNAGYFLAHRRDMTAKDRRDAIEEALSFVHLEGKGRMYPDELSGGMKKRVAIARAVVSQPDILLFDEPTTGLDPINARSILELIDMLRLRGATSVVVTHNMNDGFAIGDSFAFIHGGALLCKGTARDILCSPDPFITEFVSDMHSPERHGKRSSSLIHHFRGMVR
jgi:phospholipid/cholesterol/gamma-HCH transport system ATP-binding protein